VRGLLARGTCAAHILHSSLNAARNDGCGIKQGAIPVKNNACSSLGYRMYSENEQKKISAESLGFVLFLEQAKVLDANEREIILDRAMALKQEHINIEEMRWIVMMALWNEGREKDFLFIEDAIYQDHNLVLH
jgi:Smg protein